MDRVLSYPEANLPLTEVTYFILLSLASEARHGYAIMKSVQRLSDGRVALSTGTLYGALQRLLDQGWISQIEEAENNHPGRARRVYRLSPLGQSALNAEVKRLNSLVAAAQAYAMIQVD
jgi:DNA-binding PadR family transcriptional regulator